MTVFDGVDKYFAQLSRYDGVRLVGHGGMGAVYVAHDVVLGRPVAIKFLLPECVRDLSVVARFKREISLLSKLNHPHLVRILDACLDNEQPYFVMEYVAGRTLEQVIDEAPLPPSALVDLLLPVLSALTALHEEEVVHRDLKPGNIIVSHDYHAVLTDLGLSTTNRETVTKISRTGELVGTLGFIPPEVVLGERHTIVSDVYQMGMVFYVSLAGELPFDPTAFFAHVEGRRSSRPLCELVPTIDGRLSKIIDSCIAHDPSKRYASIERLASDLAAWLGADVARHSAAIGKKSSARPPSRSDMTSAAVRPSSTSGKTSSAARPSSASGMTASVVRSSSTSGVSASAGRPSVARTGRRVLMLTGLFGCLLIAAVLVASLVEQPMSLFTAVTLGGRGNYSFEKPRLETLDTMALRYRGPVHGRCTIGFRSLRHPYQLRSHSVDLAAARPVGDGSVALVVKLPFAIVEPTQVLVAVDAAPLVTATVDAAELATATVDAAELATATVDPTPLVDKYFAPLNAITEERLAVALDQCSKQPADVYAALAPLELSADVIAHYRRTLPKFLLGALPGSSLAKRVETLRYFEPVLGREPPWGSVSSVLGVVLRRYRAELTPVDYSLLGAASLVKRVNGKDMWLWLAYRPSLELLMNQSLTKGVVFVTALSNVRRIPGFDPLREEVPMPKDVLAEKDVLLDLDEHLLPSWPLHRAIVAIDVRAFTRYARLELTINGKGPVVIVNSLACQRRRPANDYMTPMTVHVPISPDWLQRAGNRLHLEKKFLPGVKPAIFLSISGLRIYGQ